MTANILFQRLMSGAHLVTTNSPLMVMVIEGLPISFVLLLAAT